MSSMDIDVSKSIVEPAVSTDKLVEHMKKFNELKSKLLDKQDIVSIQGKPFVKRSGWRKIALAFNISDEIVKEERQEFEKYYVWRVTVRASAPNGRYVVGTGACSSNEKTFTHGEHDVYATAHTRAKNRAISDLVGSGEVSAEEIQGTQEKNQSQNSPKMGQSQQPASNKNLNHIIKWTVKNDEYPIPIDAAPYKGLIGNKLIPTLRDKHGIRFFEETAGDNIVSIQTSDMQAEQFDEFSNALTWALQKIANCNKDAIKIWVEDSQ